MTHRGSCEPERPRLPTAGPVHCATKRVLPHAVRVWTHAQPEAYAARVWTHAQPGKRMLCAYGPLRSRKRMLCTYGPMRNGSCIAGPDKVHFSMREHALMRGWSSPMRMNSDPP